MSGQSPFTQASEWFRTEDDGNKNDYPTSTNDLVWPPSWLGDNLTSDLPAASGSGSNGHFDFPSNLFSDPATPFIQPMPLDLPSSSSAPIASSSKNTDINFPTWPQTPLTSDANGHEIGNGIHFNSPMSATDGTFNMLDYINSLSPQTPHFPKTPHDQLFSPSTPQQFLAWQQALLNGQGPWPTATPQWDMLRNQEGQPSGSSKRSESEGPGPVRNKRNSSMHSVGGESHGAGVKGTGGPDSPKRKLKPKVEGREIMEIRSRRFRDRAPKTIKDRLPKILAQRMFLVERIVIPGVDEAQEFRVVGQKNDIHTVSIDHEPRCECTEHAKGNTPCEHLIFVFLKILKIPEKSYLWFQKGLLSHELRDVFENRRHPSQQPPSIAASVPTTSGLPNDPTSVIGQECTICFDPISGEDVAMDRLMKEDSTGRTVHQDCLNLRTRMSAKHAGGNAS